MSTLAKLSKQAVQHEHDRQFEKALAAYARVFDEATAAGEEVDVALYNRAGDVAMRLGDSARAVTYFERAIDAYATGGLLNNAIAVCNKLLRHAPDHAATHYTLAVLHAKQGFRGDAKHHYVEYAERMHRAGRDEEAIRALSEFAALCPAGDDTRAALARHLAKGNRGAEITARLEAMLPAAPEVPAPPPGAAPASGNGAPLSAPAANDRRDLVFLDISLEPVSESADVLADDPVAPIAGLEFTAVGDDALDLAPSAPWHAADLPLVDALDDAEPADHAAEPPLAVALGELPSFGAAAATTEPPALETVEFDLDEPAASTPAAIVDDAFADAPSDIPLLDLGDGELTGEEPAFAIDDLASLDAAPLADELSLPVEPRWATSLPGELPPLSLAGWIGSAGGAALADVVADVAVDAPVVTAPGTEAPTPARAPRDFVDLGDWLRADQPARSTRLTTEDVQPTGDEAADFERMLSVFKAGLAQNVDAADHASHYDLGVAFREMGLVDEAISEFQRAARAPEGALRAREALGQCFLDRGSPELAVGVLQRALDEATASGAADEVGLLGVVYLLAEAHARLGQHQPARAYFQRVVATDIEFRDAARRLSQLPASTP